MSWLCVKEQYARGSDSQVGEQRSRVSLDAQRSFFGEHLAWWVPAFAAALWRKSMGSAADAAGSTANNLHAGLSRALAAFIPLERARLAIPTPRELLAPSETQLEDADQTPCTGCS